MSDFFSTEEASLPQYDRIGYYVRYYKREYERGGELPNQYYFEAVTERSVARLRRQNVLNLNEAIYNIEYSVIMLATSRSINQLINVFPIRNPFWWNQWYYVKTEQKSANTSFELRLTIFFSLFHEGVEVGLRTLGKADRQATRLLNGLRLKKHYSLRYNEDVASFLEAKLDGTRIDHVRVLDVGQGNMIAFCDETGGVLSFYDFGGGALQNKRTFPSAVTDFCLCKNPFIILSHWDTDHWSSAYRDTRSLEKTWIAPPPDGKLSTTRLIRDIEGHTGKVYFWPTSTSPLYARQLVIEKCTGRSFNNSGLSVTLHNPNDDLSPMLFPGDARYNAIPSFNTARSYHSIVVPHHGARISNATVPKPLNAPTSRWIYSFGQHNTFGHPNEVTKTRHKSQGWLDSNLRKTASRCLKCLTGNYYMSWTDDLPPYKCCRKHRASW